MSVLHRLRLAARQFGLDVQRWPTRGPEYACYSAFVSADPDVVLDVGANDGGFARQLRSFGYTREIVSFEPGSSAFDRLQASARRDPHWQVVRSALGEAHGHLKLNIAGNQGASSSPLRMLPTHEVAAPGSAYVGAELVAVQRLDNWFAAQGRAWTRPALKIDAQGFERYVLAGSGDLLSRLVSVQLELSVVQLYGESWLWDEASLWLQERGFRLAGVAPGFVDQESGIQLQFDGVFLPR